jgi:hypothetical protein
MGLWNKNEPKLERELRAQRPQARDEFVRTLSRQVAPLERRPRSALPKVALVAAVTAVLAVSLGVAGAFGAARGPVHTFSISVVNLVSPPHSPSSNTSTSTTTTNTDGLTSHADATPTHFPFQSQYGHLIPICWQGHIIYVTPRELIWYFFHGAHPARFCGGAPIHH